MRSFSLLKSFSCRQLRRTIHSDVVPSSTNPSFIKITSSKDVRKKRSDLFSKEKDRQSLLIAKMEKIDVHVQEPPKGIKCKLNMNKNVSTPFNCAMHINESVVKNPALALVGNQPWDMHRPLTDNCELKYLFFTDKEYYHFVNQAYWRSCSFVLGYILETAFKDNVSVTLHSWPSANYRTGSFVYDAKLDLAGWKPTQDELKILSKIPAQQLRSKDLPFERLEVDISVAEKIFEDNPFKLEQLNFMSKNSQVKNFKVCLYRMGDHVDISRGPMIANTNQLGFYEVTAFNSFESKDFGQLFRVQGISVPFTQRVNSWTWKIVTDSAKLKNEMPLPSRHRYEKQIGDEIVS